MIRYFDFPLIFVDGYGSRLSRSKFSSVGGTPRRSCFRDQTIHNMTSSMGPTTFQKSAAILGDQCSSVQVCLRNMGTVTETAVRRLDMTLGVCRSHVTNIYPLHEWIQFTKRLDGFPQLGCDTATTQYIEQTVGPKGYLRTIRARANLAYYWIRVLGPSFGQSTFRVQIVGLNIALSFQGSVLEVLERRNDIERLCGGPDFRTLNLRFDSGYEPTCHQGQLPK